MTDNTSGAAVSATLGGGSYGSAGLESVALGCYQYGCTDPTATNYDPSANMNDLSEDEAYAILGLEKPSSKSEISKAHKSLIQKLHPDRGGSDYLAAKINAAKDKIS